MILAFGVLGLIGIILTQPITSIYSLNRIYQEKDAHALGLKDHGVQANNNRYWRGSLLIWNFREQVATVAAFLDVYMNNPVPVLGDPELYLWTNYVPLLCKLGKTTTFRVFVGEKSCRLDKQTVDKSRLFVDKCLRVWRSGLFV